MNQIREKRDVCYVLVENPESSNLLEGPVIRVATPYFWEFEYTAQTISATNLHH